LLLLRDRLSAAGPKIGTVVSGIREGLGSGRTVLPIAPVALGLGQRPNARWGRRRCFARWRSPEGVMSRTEGGGQMTETEDGRPRTEVTGGGRGQMRTVGISGTKSNERKDIELQGSAVVINLLFELQREFRGIQRVSAGRTLLLTDQIRRASRSDRGNLSEAWQKRPYVAHLSATDRCRWRTG